MRIIRVARPGWQAGARCRDLETQRHLTLFFPREKASTQPAREFCLECPVAESCLAYALAHPNLVGIWAGTTEEERDRLRHRLKVAAQ